MREDADGWQEVEIAFDSRAAEKLVSEDVIKSAEIREAPASRRGDKYGVTNGIHIPNVCENIFQAVTGDGFSGSIVAQVFDVNKPLATASRVVEDGNRFVCDDLGS